MTKWIKDGKIVDPVTERVEQLDIIVEGERISKILPCGIFTSDSGEVEVIDAAGKLVVPGFIDMHTHLREPGYEYKETIASGSLAAAAGGFTAIACMPNTDPPNDSRSVTEFIVEQAERANLVRVYPIAAISVGQKGERLTEFGDLKEAGAVGLSDDGRPVVNSELMRRAMEYARFHGLTVISHCEDLYLSEGGVMHEGEVSTKIGLPGIPGASEEIMVYREICLARHTGCPVHIAHVSTAESVALIRRAKEAGLPVTAETAPHYFTLDHRAVMGYDTNAKVNPPLRSEKDVEAVKQGLKDGTIDVIATDHAPHSPLEKEVEFDRASPGMIGLETAFSLTLALVKEGVLTLPEAIKKLSLIPSRILGVTGGSIEEGGRADLTLVDDKAKYVLTENEILSKSKNTPFIGKELCGRAVLTMVGGRVVWQRTR
ncbi:MAG: dihydroorotase [Deltaproteobacteria bacterium]|nr:dihydroorotase [Deltaproteobacteria bacterium]RLB80628.1 MAG: dihydroorotase [Deltaproteobacteria bacterium]HDM09119.1 dihydroorotase [Desulfobacteraceae bacterium]